MKFNEQIIQLDLQLAGASPYLTLLLELIGLPIVLALAVHQVNFFGWMDQEDHSEPLLLLALFYSFMVKSYGCWCWWWGGVGGSCENSVSPRPKSFFLAPTGAQGVKMSVCVILF